MSIIAGLPYETPETFENGLSWLRQNWSTEGSLVFPLYIPKENGGDNQSKMSKKWVEYGYEEIDERNIIELKEKYKTTMAMAYGVGDSLVSTTGMLWKNKDWDILQVAERVTKYWHESYYPHHNGPPMWNLGLWEMVLNKDASDLLDKRIIEMAPNMGHIRTQSKKYIDAYITKKLNWTPQ